MKNPRLIVALAATSILISFTNLKAQKGFQIGAELTPQFSYLVNQADIDSPLFKEKHAFNGSFGITTQLGFTENIGIGLNLIHSFQGSQYEWKGRELYKLLQYVKVPLMLTVSIPFAERMMFVGKVGPQFSILTDAKLLDDNRVIIINDYYEAFALYEWSAMLSAGIAYRINDYVSIDMAMRYDVGLTNAEDEMFARNVHFPFDVTTPAPASSPRGTTRNVTMGLAFGVRYILH